MERKPAVAGSFYPSDPEQLRHMIRQFMSLAEAEGHAGRQVISCVAPHAGYVYSGGVAAYAYNAIKHAKNLGKVDTFVVIGPNHTGRGYPISISNADAWITPLGKVANDREFAEAVAENDAITVDEEAHRFEHSVEVQLPFLQSVVEKPRCIFVCMGDQSYDSGVTLEKAVSRAANKLNRKVILIASSDFNHYESANAARKKDIPAIKELESLNAKGFHNSIERNDDSACGYGPITVAALFAKEQGIKSGKLLKYANSGEITGDYNSVVAYASIVFSD
jgi:MEMO1 family protein